MRQKIVSKGKAVDYKVETITKIEASLEMGKGCKRELAERRLKLFCMKANLIIWLETTASQIFHVKLNLERLEPQPDLQNSQRTLFNIEQS